MACSLTAAFVLASNPLQTDQQSTSSSASDMGKTVTITGCLRSGTSPNSYVLNNVMSSDMSRQSYQRGKDQSENQTHGEYGDQGWNRSTDTPDLQHSAQSGSTPSEMARAETSYTLIPGKQVDLKSHIGQKVEVTGMMAEASSQMSPNRTPSTTERSSANHDTHWMSGQPHFKVSSIRQLSGSCQ